MVTLFFYNNKLIWGIVVLNMCTIRKWHLKQKIERTLKALKKNGFEAIYVSTGKEAAQKVLDLIPVDALVEGDKMELSVKSKKSKFTKKLQIKKKSSAELYSGREKTFGYLNGFLLALFALSTLSRRYCGN